MAKPEPSACIEASIEVGDVIAGKYVVRAILGQGGMGLVCEATHVQLDERVAIKLLTRGGERVPAARTRFMREARITAKLRGEHTARVTDFGLLAEGTPYMVMEYLEGLDLKRLLREEHFLPPDVAVHYVVQACFGLAEAHALGIVHRDLKPSNIFVTRRPDGSDLIKIVDFGVSKSFNIPWGEEDITATGAILGSPRYMAPEQLEDSVRVDQRADIWSIGAVLYEMLAGHPPFMAESPAALCHSILGGERPSPLVGRVRGVTRELEGVVSSCMDRNLDTRIPSVAALARALAEATELEGVAAAAVRIEGILQRAAPPELDLQTGSRPGRPRSGSSSSVSQVGPVARTLWPPRRYSLLWLGIAAGFILTSVGAVLWARNHAHGTHAEVPSAGPSRWVPKEQPPELPTASLAPKHAESAQPVASASAAPVPPAPSRTHLAPAHSKPPPPAGHDVFDDRF